MDVDADHHVEHPVLRGVLNAVPVRIPPAPHVPSFPRPRLALVPAFGCLELALYRVRASAGLHRVGREVAPRIYRALVGVAAAALDHESERVVIDVHLLARRLYRQAALL